ncbi:hypothetical protein AVEN_140530-1 [Araneus ventricosus]|uniref:Uncharacterized protein n=1 Tax=Araneus ventricosus TaxID=182803 RepID=A0A4Y2QVL5_ARAVE|nr:hypothetical protein AVEN_140530-1 [Araneus ventricosus]
MAAETAAANLHLNEGVSTSTGSFTMSSGLGLPLPNYSVECLPRRIWEKIDEHCTKHFVKHFTENEFYHLCNVCDRLWFLENVTPASKNEKFLSVLRAEFPDKDVQSSNLCVWCKRSLQNSKITPLSRNNGFINPNRTALPSLDPIS